MPIDNEDIQQLRMEYGQRRLSKADVEADPLNQFTLWFEEAVAAEARTANAMVLATVDTDGSPDLRVVLLKELSEQGFIFFTHYNSVKAQQMQNNSSVALNAFWPELARQVRVRGRAEKVSAEVSDAYFAKRPHDAQIAAWASQQSQILLDEAELSEQFAYYQQRFADQEVPRPDAWGGFCVIPWQIEFWQGRDARLHDRVRYTQRGQQWLIEQLAP